VQDSGTQLSNLAPTSSVAAETARAQAAEALLAPIANPVFTGLVTAPVLGTTMATSLNGVLNANQFPGADIGAKVNAAIAALGANGGRVFIPSGSYSQSTTIVKPRNVSLVGAGAYSTTLTFTPSTGWAVVITDSFGASINYPEGELADLSLVGPGSGSTTGGIYLGGSDSGTFNGVASPSVGISPVGNYGDHQNINRVRVFNGFGVGWQMGENTWSCTMFQCLFSNNGVSAYVGGSTGENSGENICFIGCRFQNSTIGLQSADSNQTDVHCIGCSFDYNTSWAIKIGTAGSNQCVTIDHCHIEQQTKWLQNYGFTSLIGCDFVNGTNSSILGYLIDNQNEGLTVVGGTFFNSGSGAIINPAGQPSVWLGVTANTAINTNGGTNIDRFGNVAAQGLSLASKVSVYSGITTAGNGVPSETFQVLAGGLAANYNSGTAQTIFTPTTTSILRISFIEYSQNAPTGATLPSLTLSWSDASNTAQTLAIFSATGSVSAAGVYATNYASLTTKGSIEVVIMTNASTPVKVTSASYAAGSGTALQYALGVTVEQL
jgi:hypothetical protein